MSRQLKAHDKNFFLNAELDYSGSHVAWDPSQVELVREANNTCHLSPDDSHIYQGFDNTSISLVNQSRY